MKNAKEGGVSYMTERLTPINNEGGKELIPRETLVEEWRNASQRLYRYPRGEFRDPQGEILYTYPEGARLLILGQEVMDDCQTTWANATVDKAFESLGGKKDVDVLERGFGMGLVATRTFQHLEIRGGTYTVIELNKQVAEYARTNWLNKQNRISKTRATSPLGGKDTGTNISFKLIEGDAYEETQKLAEAEDRFDIIISDTFPLSEEERSVNDLLDIETLVRCLRPDGVFAFFGYHAGSQGGMNDKQRAIIERFFNDVHITRVAVSPPPDYQYFQTPNGPLRELPVIICRQLATH